ncbi:MAG: RimK/LysX family protein [Myxococcota bacterium]
MARRPTIGWRERVALEDLGLRQIKAKVDTGARSSALHAWNLREELRDGERWILFEAHPRQHDDQYVVGCEAPLHDERFVKSSNGLKQLRPVIRTRVALAGQSWLIDLSLAPRDMMGFRMLLGREALRGRFHVDAGASFLVSEDKDS